MSGENILNGSEIVSQEEMMRRLGGRTLEVYIAALEKDKLKLEKEIEEIKNSGGRFDEQDQAEAQRDFEKMNRLLKEAKDFRKFENSNTTYLKREELSTDGFDVKSAPEKVDFDNVNIDEINDEDELLNIATYPMVAMDNSIREAAEKKWYKIQEDKSRARLIEVLRARAASMEQGSNNVEEQEPSIVEQKADNAEEQETPPVEQEAETKDEERAPLSQEERRRIVNGIVESKGKGEKKRSIGKRIALKAATMLLAAGLAVGLTSCVQKRMEQPAEPVIETVAVGEMPSQEPDLITREDELPVVEVGEEDETYKGSDNYDNYKLLTAEEAAANDMSEEDIQKLKDDGEIKNSKVAFGGNAITKLKNRGVDVEGLADKGDLKGEDRDIVVDFVMGASKENKHNTASVLADGFKWLLDGTDYSGHSAEYVSKRMTDDEQVDLVNKLKDMLSEDGTKIEFVTVEGWQESAYHTTDGDRSDANRKNMHNAIGKVYRAPGTIQLKITDKNGNTANLNLKCGGLQPSWSIEKGKEIIYEDDEVIVIADVVEEDDDDPEPPVKPEPKKPEHGKIGNDAHAGIGENISEAPDPNSLVTEQQNAETNSGNEGDMGNRKEESAPRPGEGSEVTYIYADDSDTSGDTVGFSESIVADADTKGGRLEGGEEQTSEKAGESTIEIPGSSTEEERQEFEDSGNEAQKEADVTVGERNNSDSELEQAFKEGRF